MRIYQMFANKGKLNLIEDNIVKDTKTVIYSEQSNLNPEFCCFMITNNVKHPYSRVVFTNDKYIAGEEIKGRQEQIISDIFEYVYTSYPIEARKDIAKRL